MPEEAVQALLNGLTACKDDAALRDAGKAALAACKAAGDREAYKRVTEHVMYALDALKAAQ
jgi:hypothetical protein